MWTDCYIAQETEQLEEDRAVRGRQGVSYKFD